MSCSEIAAPLRCRRADLMDLHQYHSPVLCYKLFNACRHSKPRPSCSTHEAMSLFQSAYLDIRERQWELNAQHNITGLRISETYRPIWRKGIFHPGFVAKDAYYVRGPYE